MDDASASGKRDMKRVLIVDDEAGFLQSLCDGFCSSKRLAVFTALNGREALEILDRKAIDLVVTDLFMPVMDGFELIGEMNRRHPDIPVIVMSAFLNNDTEQRLAALGVVGFLEKPLDFDDFARRIEDSERGYSKEWLDSIPLP
ncbi:MAG TPA: response regulator [Dissulfurispiraceae bacterium]|nr:response regulator [Dissulfurispiraceae bacterium]